MFMATVFFACSDEYDRSAGGNISAINPVLNMLSQNEFLIEKAADSAEEEFLFRLSWAEPRISYKNGLPAEVANFNYKIQAGVLGDAFEEAVTVAETDNLFEDIYSAKLYSVAEELAGENFEGTVNLEFRILAAYDDISDSLISNSITVIVLQREIEEPVEPVELTIRFKQTVGDWDAFAVYAWGESEVYGGWPGLVLEADADGWYSLIVPVNRPINLILNNNGGGSQLDFLADPTSDACYEINSTDGTWAEVECPPVIQQDITIRFKQTVGTWEVFAVYAWGESEVFGGWPGLALEAGTDGWYSFTVPGNRPLNLIMSNNGAGRQFDFISSPESSACYEFNTESSTYALIDCD